jgi:hypothetical protein
MNAEQKRLDEARENKTPWKKRGPYLSERQWGTVREDYSEILKERLFGLTNSEGAFLDYRIVIGENVSLRRCLP